MSDLSIRQGSTFSTVLRWEAGPIVYKPITGITQGAPVRLTVPGHGMPSGWRAAVTGVKGMTEINATANAIKDKDYHQVSIVDANNVEFNDTNASGFKAYVSGGVLQYNTAVDLGGYTARMSVKDKVGGTELLSLTTTNSRIVLDNTFKTITLLLTATETAALTWKSAVYDLEMVSGSGVVTPLLSGKVVVSKEITT